LKVIHIINSLGQGGAEHSLLRLVKNSRDKNQYQIISLMKEDFFSKEFEDIGVKVHYMNMKRGLRLFIPFIKIFRIIARYEPDIVQSWMYHSNIILALLSPFLRCKIFWNLRSGSIDHAESSTSTIYALRLSAIITKILNLNIISCSKKGIEWHKEYGFRGNFFYIPNAVDECFFDHDKGSLEKAEENKYIFMVSCVGRYAKQKNHILILDAISILIKEFKDIRISFIGKNMDKNNQELSKHINSRDLSSFCFLQGPKNGLKEIYGNSDVHVLSSSFGEGFPNVVAESMALGIPNIVTNIGDSGLIVGKTGWVISGKADAYQLASKIKEAYIEWKYSKNSWKSRQTQCISRVRKKYRLSVTISKYEEVWTNE